MSFKLVAAVLDMKVGNPLRKMVLIKLADQANDDGVCWPSYESIAKTCEISRRSVISHIQWLEENGFLRIEKRYNSKESKNFSNNYHLTLDNGKQVAKQQCKSRTSETDALGGENAALGGETDSPSNGENAAPEPIIKPTNKPINESDSPKPKKTKFVKPTFEQVKDYYLEKGQSNAEQKAQRFIDYNETVGWVVGKNRTPMKDWKAAIRTWINKDSSNQSQDRGFNHANNQPTFGQSSADSYAAKLQADLANRFPDEFGQPVGGYYVNQ